MTNALSEESRAWVNLGQRLGQLAGSVGGQATGQIKVTACGKSNLSTFYQSSNSFCVSKWYPLVTGIWRWEQMHVLNFYQWVFGVFLLFINFVLESVVKLFLKA